MTGNVAVATLLATAIGAGVTPPPSTDGFCCAVIELRQYTLKPGQRETLIELFDRYLLDPQEEAGMTIVGQFRDRKREDRFVWVRGFPDMARRLSALGRFYDGPIWAAYRNAANATMVDSDDVLLLKPARPELGFRLGSPDRESPTGGGLVVAGIYTLEEPASPSLVERFEDRAVPVLAGNGLRLSGLFVTESAPNSFRLPVREGENVLVWFGERDAEPRGGFDATGMADALALDGVKPRLLDLDPTARSLLGAKGGPRGAGARATSGFAAMTGAWKVHNRYLRARLSGSDDWVEFEAESRVEPLLDGLGQIDRYSAEREGKRIEGLTLRLLDPATGEWTLYWADTVRPGKVLPPMVGRLRDGDGSGEFFGNEEVDGRRVRCRFLWTGLGTDAPRWEQAFSDDEGRTWETNWIMTFTRVRR
jgi:hypothetical protein